MAITPNYDLDIDSTLGGNDASDYVIPSQKAIKSYVDNNTGSTVDQVYDPASQAAQSGIAIAGANFLTSSDLANYVTTNTDQNITGTKTFVGQKKIEFKQSAAADKLGFTCFNTSNTEIGAFEYRPNTIGSGALFNINVPYSSTSYVGFRYWGTAVNVVAPKVATAGTYYIPTHITDGNTTVTASNAGVVDISSLLPTVPTTDQTYDGTSTNAQSGVAIEGAGFLQNTATGTNSLTILGTPTTNTNAVNIGYDSATNGRESIAIGYSAEIYSTNGAFSIAIGSNARTDVGSAVAIGPGADVYGSGGVSIGSGASANGSQSLALGSNANAMYNSSIQIGYGTNSDSNTLSVGFYNTQSTHYNWQLLDGATGLIPDARLSSNIARASAIPDTSNLADKDLSNLSSTGQAVIDGKANTDLSNLSTTGQAVIDGKVNKSGDTMTGGLFVNNFTGNRGQLQLVSGSYGCIIRNDGSSTWFLLTNSGDAYGEFNSLRPFRIDNSTGTPYFANTPCVDGQWINSNQAMFTTAPSLSASTDLEYRITLPNDGHKYEVLLRARIQTGSSTGNYAYCIIRGNEDTYARYGCGARTRTNSNVLAMGTVLVTASYVASGSKNLRVSRSTNFTGGTLEILETVAYRRIGTNA